MKIENCKICDKEIVTVEVKIHFGSEIRTSGYCSVVCMAEDFK